MRSCGLAGILVLAVALGVTAEMFTGSWEAEIGLAPQQTQPFTTFQSTLDVGICLGFVTLNSVSDFVIDGWIWEELGLVADVGLLAFDGHMLYDPQTGSMLYAEAVLSINAGPLIASLYGAMTGEVQSEPANYGFVFDIKGEVFGGGFTFESATYLGADLSGISFTASGSAGDSPLLTKMFLTDPTIDPMTAVFSGQDITFSGTMFACITLTSLTSFSAAGFESEQLTAEFRNLFGLPLTMTLDLLYETQTKSYTFSPSMETDFGCLFLYSTIVNTGTVLTGLELYGIKVSATIGSATFQSISNLDTTTYVITTPEYGSIVESLADAEAAGHAYYPQDYWEALSLVVGIPPLGSGFWFSLETFFSTTDGLLFDWAASTMGITLALGASVSTSSTVTVDATGFTGWSVSFRVSW
jgi:hypothetical protein